MCQHYLRNDALQIVDYSLHCLGVSMLVPVCVCAGAWIITGGSNAGVMEFVGEAVKEYMLTQGVIEQQIVALGIATWGIVDNKEALVDPDVRTPQLPCTLLSVQPHCVLCW